MSVTGLSVHMLKLNKNTIGKNQSMHKQAFTAERRNNMNQLEQSRIEIDAIDTEMAKLFEKRMKASAAIAEYKKANALPITDRIRENEILTKRSELIKDDIYREYYSLFLKDVMKISCAYQNRILNGMKVVYSGCEGAFGHIAAKKLFPAGELHACNNFTDAYTAVERGEYDCAILPIENSFAGDVGVVMDLMYSGSLYVSQMIELDVEHNLLTVSGASADAVKTVVSHPQALSQCEDYIREHGYETVSYSNTALAAKYVKEKNDPTYAAIASCETAEVFGLTIAEKNINTQRSNTTRFAVFTRALNKPSPMSKNENEHFILLFTAKNEAGALAQALNIIGAHNFNMRNLRSRPLKNLLWRYYFFVEIEGNVNTEDAQNMMKELSAVCAGLKLAGTYN